MEWEDTPHFTPEELVITEIVVDEVPNSQNPFYRENEYNPFPSQSQVISQAGPSTSTETSYPVRWFTAETEPDTEQKRPGRPRKESLEVLKPSRESKRVKKLPKVLKYESFENNSYKWSERDKALFLAGCLKVGIQDIEGLQGYLPHKSEVEIKEQIQMWKSIAAKRFEQKLSSEDNDFNFYPERIRNLDGWFGYFCEKAKMSKEDNLISSNIFLIVAEYGDFPPPEECGGVDARAMYRYLHCMMNGLPPYGINQTTSKVIQTCLGNLMEELNDPEFVSSMEKDLLNPPLKPDQNKFGKTYSRKGKNVTAKDIEKIINCPIMNPLNLPEEAMVIPKC